MFTTASIRPCFFPSVKSTLPTPSSFWLLSLTLGGGEDFCVCQLALLGRKSGISTIAHLKPMSQASIHWAFPCSFHGLLFLPTSYDTKDEKIVFPKIIFYTKWNVLSRYNITESLESRSRKKYLNIWIREFQNVSRYAKEQIISRHRKVFQIT